MTKETLADKVWRKKTKSTGEWKGLVFEEPVKEHIQNVQRRLKERVCDCKEGRLKCVECRVIDKIFKEEIGEDLL